MPHAAPTPASHPDPVERLRALLHLLRGPGGCPWDAEQTHRSLLPNLIEEAYEVADTIERDDPEDLREELGDLLLQVVFHSELAEEAGRFDWGEVATGVCEKLVRRHPHVFGDSQAGDSQAVLRQWDAIKRAEKGQQAQPYLHGIGQGLPALLRAAKLQKKAAKVGFDWRNAQEVIAKVREELVEVEEELAGGSQKLAEELGDLLFAVVNLVRQTERDPELLLAAANQKFTDRFTQIEQGLAARRSSLEEASLEEMEALWNEAKTRSPAKG
ncbi:MAG: nucleoside triphosphate pyrophosphohydrolase [Verrucomicrobiota bacterium]